MASRVLRPSGTTSNTGWTISAGTLHGVLSDDSDASYADGNGSDIFEVALDPSAFDPADLGSTAGHFLTIRAASSYGEGEARVYSGATLLNTEALFIEAIAPGDYGTELGKSQASWPSGAKPDRVVVEMTGGDLTIYEISVTYADSPAPPPSTRRRRAVAGLLMGS